ncbi:MULTISPECIES: hypothetical protein [Bacillus]|uniref:hypothetical protein n=1 Tax=Bacillus TaxID=1386 RepID=UPI000C28FC4E|nr:hypothetical protein [Bacillus cereus]UIJ66696.1 hypothetical protein LW858_28665 [Bacillus cereus]HDR8251252.1 hypothetical protein [Bacillus cereus]
MYHLSEFKEQLGVYWDLITLFLGAVLGIMIPAMYKQICHYYKRLRVKLKLKNLAGIEDLNILKISSANPYYGNNDININVGERCLYIGFPKKLLDQVLKHDEKFEIHADCSFDGSKMFEDVIKQTGISDLNALIEKHKDIVAQQFVNQEEGCLFNRPKFGVYNMNTDQRKGYEEVPEVKMELFHTDYFTHRVVRSIYGELKERGDMILDLDQENMKEGLKKYNFFTTSLGINAFVISDSKDGESIIFSKRAQGAAYSENAYKYNSTVMEGISQTDYNSYEVSLKKALERGVYEELGISSSLWDKFEADYRFFDVFLEKNYFEIGITASVRLNTLFEESIKDLPGQDKELEIGKLVAIPKRKRELEKFINENDIYNQGLFTLKMICARDLLFLMLKRKS